MHSRFKTSHLMKLISKGVLRSIQLRAGARKRTSSSYSNKVTISRITVDLDLNFTSDKAKLSPLAVAVKWRNFECA